jgi:glycosyltransferase involved in cell wall biosynthesis
MVSPWYSLRESSKHVDAFFVRSQHEARYVEKVLNVKPDLIFVLPLSCRLAGAGDTVNFDEKEDFCLHVSILSSVNKNVKRLIGAAIKYKFKLVLAGSYGTNDYGQFIQSVVTAHDNIKYVGFLSDQELIDMYDRARVFALPSLFEGVGLVALEAAARGADIVLTNRGAPKEYYDGMAFLVDPESVDEIGMNVIDILAGKTMQPKLSLYINRKYNFSSQVQALESSYAKLLS